MKEVIHEPFFNDLKAMENSHYDRLNYEDMDQLRKKHSLSTCTPTQHVKSIDIFSNQATRQIPSNRSKKRKMERFTTS